MSPSRSSLWIRGVGLLLAGLIVGGTLLTGLPVRSAVAPQDVKPATKETPAAEADPFPIPADRQGVDLGRQSRPQADAKSKGCVSCHKDSADPHPPNITTLGCTDCHGGDPTTDVKELAHVQPRFPEAWASSANPIRSYTLLNHESPEFIQFVNPGDLRVAHIACTGCHNGHANVVGQVHKSMMTHGAMLWGAALYNNGAVPFKRARFGEAYSMHGKPVRLQTVPAPTEEEITKKGVLPYLDPLIRYEQSQPANILRIFERGGRFRPEVGIPEREEEPGRPRTRLSNRGIGTENRTDPVWIGLAKTRLLDPTLNFMGTNDHAGDYRSSGCTACHVIYANDRSPVHSGPYAAAGHRGLTQTADPTIPKDESGHPIKHEFTRAIPTSQCMICHMHPGTTVINTYLGYMWWDLETDGELMYPEEQKYPTAEETAQAAMFNPEDSALRGNWGDPEFLDKVWELNPQLKHTQFADFHGHGWVYRAVFKQDRKGNQISHTGKVLGQAPTAQMQAAMKFPEKVKELYKSHSDNDAATVKKELAKLQQAHADAPVHYLDIHLEKGMHCIDCHFDQDNHGNGKLYGEMRAPIEIQCIDCHGTVTERAKLTASGPGDHPKTRDLLQRGTASTTPFGRRKFDKEGDRIFQNSMVEPGLRWEIVQTVDVITEGSPHYNEKARLAKTVRREGDNLVWGNVPSDPAKLAHANSNMSCIACHSSWNPSCFGCHLPQKANKKMPTLHNEGDVTRNYTSYNWQTLRDDVYMLARDGDVTGNRIGPVRSACAIHVGSYNNNRESIYVQQQTISADGLSGIAFSTNVPHTVRGANDTKMCTDCHLSKKDDNNAIMAQLLMHGTNYTNWIGKYCWVANGEHGLHAVIVTETEEPQAVIGSSLHRLAYPDNYRKHEEHDRMLEHAHEHPGKDISDNLLHPFRKHEVLSLQHRGEYLYAACGAGGLRVFDIAFIDDKAFAERITTAPVSPVGQKFYVPTKYAAAVAAPATTAPDPTRKQHPENKEPAVHLLYAFLYVADHYEGLILVGAGTLLDGNPLNNYLKRALTYNPDGLLCGARGVTIVGTYAYVSCDAGLVVVDLNNPLEPKVAAVLGEKEGLHHPHAVQVQFRYGYVCDEEGIKVLDCTDPGSPRVINKLIAPELSDVHNIYLARTYAYVAGGEHGLVILDIENPAKPKIDQVFNADGCMTEVHDVKLGITNVSQFAYVADGEHGLRVVQLTSPETPGNTGFSPRPTPELIATYKMHGHALAIAEGVDRDRAVDEAGNQLSVFGRVGARPLSLAEQHKLYLYKGQPWKVSDDPNDPDYGKPLPNPAKQAGVANRPSDADVKR
jgi:hypothetical protein